MKIKNSFKAAALSLLVASAFAFRIDGTSDLHVKIMKTDFSGTWKLNENKSNFGEGPRFASSQLVVTQNGDKLTVERTMKNRNGEEMKRNSNYTLDGKEYEETVRNRPRKVTASWADEGKEITITSSSKFERNGEEMEFNSKETWKLSADGKSLTVDSNISSPRGERKMQLVYDKSK
jgi:hypothetical protein